MRTPWGIADSWETVFDCITHFGTPSHGGIAVPKEYHAFLTKETVERLAENPSEYEIGILWFEEDYAYRLPLLEIKAAMHVLDLDELREEIAPAIHFGGEKQLALEHPLYDLIRQNANDPKIKEAISKARQRVLEDELLNSPGGVKYRYFAQTEKELLSQTKEIHGGDAQSIDELRDAFEEKNMKHEFSVLKSMFDAGKLVFTGTTNGDLYIAEKGQSRFIHIDQYPKGALTLLLKR